VHPASVIAHYTIERELGRGAMGVVYLARDTRLDRLVAIKSLPPDLAFDPARRDRVEREARTLAAISHPNIGAIFGLERDEDGSYLILELAEGLTLQERLERGPMSVAEAVEVTRQIALGLGAAHARGIVHRDLKPANIKLRPDGVVKVLDFGIAMAGEIMGGPADAGAATLVSTRTSPADSGWILVGTPGYMSPEQTRGKPVDPATDVWALGCILYECLARRPAFIGETVADLIAATLLLEPDMRELPRATPPGVRKLLLACLSKERASRTIPLEDLAAMLDREMDAPHAPSSTTSATTTAATDASTAASAHVEDRVHPQPIPSPPDRTLARSELVASIVKELQSRRIVSLLSGSGCGSSTLAALVARGWAQSQKAPALWAWMGGATDPIAMHAALAQAAGLPAATNSEAATRLARTIRESECLLILDDAAPAAAGLADQLLRAAPNLRILVAGKARLGLDGELVIAAPALATPTPAEASRGQAAEGGRLLLERAMAAMPTWRPDSDAIAQSSLLARRLGGWPLAIELAAGFIPDMSPAQMIDRLEQRLRMSGLSFTERLPAEVAHRVMIQWVLDRVSPGELAILLQACVFSRPTPLRPIATLGGAAPLPDQSSSDIGGAPLPSEARVGLTIARLSALGLVNVWSGADISGETGSSSLYEVPEPVRAEVRARPQVSAVLDAVASRHMAWAMASMEQALPRLAGSGGSLWTEQADRAAIELTLGSVRQASGAVSMNAARALLRRYRLERGA
jgi:serine/threonine protein kinase